MPLLARLRAALAPVYIIDRELAKGGSSVVFLARDTALDRDVAIKVMRPELATARAVERFNREARTLANLNHPNIVPVYSAGEADGLFYFVMPFMRGETLAQRVARKLLSAREAARIGVEILDALAAAHRVGVIHRDVTARNVFVENGHALVADFGLSSAHASTSDQSGTIGSMPPEQFASGEVGAATDVYAVGALLYFALTGRAWRLTVQDEGDLWTGVPLRMRRVLRGALQWSPTERYASAEAFARALRRSALPRALLVAAVVMLLATAGVLTVWNKRRAPSPDSDLAILPFQVRGDGDARLGRDLATLVNLKLEGVPDLRVTPSHFAFRWFDAQRAHDYRGLHAKRYVSGTVMRQNKQLTVNLTLFEKDGTPHSTLRVAGSADSLVQLGDSLALGLLLRTHPRFASSVDVASPVSTRNVAALLDFLHGEQDFRHGAWVYANNHYRSAVANDSTFLLAWWRLLNTRRWMPTAVPDPRLDLAPLYQQYGSALSELDRMLIEAQLTDSATLRIERLEHAANEFPRNGYAALLYGDELFHRGALSGLPLSRALNALEEAGARDPFLAPAQEHIAWAAIRLGDRHTARRALDHLKRIAQSPESVDLDTPAFFEQAYAARFEPQHSASARQAFFDTASTTGMAGLRLGVRAGVMVGSPETQRLLAAVLLDAPAATRQDHGNAHQAMALANFTTGRRDEAFAAIDKAATVFGTPESQLEAGEWRVLGFATGWPVVTYREVTDARTVLARLSQHPATAARAHWALSVDQLARGDFAAARQSIRQLRARGDSTAIRLAALSVALMHGRRREYAAAMRTSSTLLRYEAHGKLNDPFARAILHLSRAEWRRRMGDDVGAEAELVWTENHDIVGWPGGSAQSAEVDWAYGLFALSQRASLAQQRGDLSGACDRLREARNLAPGATLPAALLTAELRLLIRRCQP